MAAETPGQLAVLRGPHRSDLLREESLGNILAATAARRPRHPALIWGSHTVTYGELNAAADAIACALASREARPGQIVGLFLPRGTDVLIAQAGITKSGAAWLPFDADVPIERMRACLQLATASALVTTREWLPRLSAFPVPVWAVEDLLADRTSSLSPAGAQPSDPAYVMFTSGSTGQPKGIVISQRSICHFLRCENDRLGVGEGDRVYQGFSIAFDMSLEEIWMSYLVGATVWIAPASTAADPDAIALALNRERISVLHVVPTLMGLIDDPLPDVRLINLGGEACPDALADRLVRAGRRVFNTYGPTETSVSATLAELQRGEPVTIGMPLPNVGVMVVDHERRPLPEGSAGELCIFGPGVAGGYLGRPDLTAERFVANPIAADPNEARMYVTGDLARIDPGGPVHWLGRADGQVKIRGFRIELDEITTALTDQSGVTAAAAVVRQVAGIDQIVGFVVPRSRERIDTDALRDALAERLPRYMMPAHLELVSELPRLTSGKIDLERLRAAPLTVVAGSGVASAAPRNEDEEALYTAVGAVCPGRRLDPDMDFFDDLGGHSLLVARLVSILRSDARYAALSIGDVYRERRLARIALVMERERHRRGATAAVERVAVPVRRRWWCGVAQAAVTPCFVLFRMADWLAPFFVYHYFTGDEGDSIPLAVLYSLATFVLARIGVFAVAIAGKWLTAGRLKAGRFPLWGVIYFRWWLARRFSELPDVYLLASTPWMTLYLRALGARVGRDVLIDTITIGAPELLTIDDGVTVGTFVNLENARVEGGELILGPIRLQEDSVVDSYAVLENDTTVGRRSRLCALSALSAGRAIPKDEIWDGAPARRTDQVDEPLPPRPHVPFLRSSALALFSATTAIFVSVLFFLPAFPAFMLIDWLDVHTLDVFDSHLGPVSAFGLFFLLAIPASTLFIGLTMTATAGLRWLLPRQAAGRSSVHSLAFWRKRFVTLIIDASLDVLHGLYASVFAPVWLRCLGVAVGRHAEISTAEGMVPDLLNLGDDTFVGDGAILGDEETRGGWMILKSTRIGSRTFIGNGAYVPDGAVVPDDVLIGVQTRTPRNEQLAGGQIWIGSPPLLLPARECVTGFPASLTFRPSRLRKLQRGTIEALRIVLPLAVIIAVGYVIVHLVMPLAEDGAWTKVALALSVAGCVYGVASFLLVVALKWMFVGRYRPCAVPMWTPFVWASEAVTSVYESLAVPNFLDILRGTPMLPWALRLLGARMGTGIYIDTTDLTEFDCVSIGDDAELNAWSGPQTHLFEDRVMKIGRIEIGARVTVGARTTMLYDTRVGDDVRLGPLTLVAKGEDLPASTRWEGTPAAPITA
jgi:non-ribosomal peptide synthetase-like protein